MSCPICHKETDPKYRPFCSKRCADIDLAKWLNGSYVIPGDLSEEEERAPDGPPGGGDPIQ
ncbi:DNA gyrase inhibitor YacG [Paenirhodobacter populi]|uniref:DNA gyrase inhibitor YacG n=1 Tax=Paenirhodobacter populi TaxID=2306993 RepID=A0A443ITM7_9RHOB|nr:DNA gyrase inhibitor YacG [Sinirhodobacter populi]RWR11051.1 DNA gyrase inhibitor YacG [Sinirhodobacter populi]